MFVDELTVNIKPGKGGDGIVAWRHEKGKEFMGPGGGNGGNGGDVYIRAVSDIGRLARYRNIKYFQAEDGLPGRNFGMTGRNGEDLVLELPVGSVVKNKKTGAVVSLDAADQIQKILEGGKGGMGNESFKSSRNTTPKEFTLGKDGDEAEFFIEVQLVVDGGIIGLPNAGKSSLLNTITRSHAKVGDFPFTTIEPNLGNFFGKILADIPGLIEGASEGKGLGHTFLRHIRRTRALIHCISAENESPVDAYKTILRELEAFDSTVAQKPQIILLTKVDSVPEEIKIKHIKELKQFSPNVFPVSILDDDSVKRVSDTLTRFLN